MLLTAFVDPESFETVNFTDEAAAVTAAQLFVDIWERYFIWLTPQNACYEAACAASESKISPQVAKVLSRAKARGRFYKPVLANPPALPFRNAADIDQTKLGSNLLSLSPFGAIAVGFPVGRAAMTFNRSVEAVRIDCLTASQKLRATIAKSTTPVVRGSSRNVIWDERFHALASSSNAMVVDDKFCIERLLEQADWVQNNFPPHKFVEKMADTNGLCYIMAKLGNRLSRTSLIVYSSYSGKSDLQLAVQVLKNYVPTAPKASVLEIRACPRSQYPDHDRFIRFDQLITTMGSGLELFDAAVTTKPHQFTLTINAPEFRTIETDLKRICVTTEPLN